MFKQDIIALDPRCLSSGMKAYYHRVTYSLSAICTLVICAHFDTVVLHAIFNRRVYISIRMAEFNVIYTRKYMPLLFVQTYSRRFPVIPIETATLLYKIQHTQKNLRKINISASALRELIPLISFTSKPLHHSVDLNHCFHVYDTYLLVLYRRSHPFSIPLLFLSLPPLFPLYASAYMIFCALFVQKQSCVTCE